MRYGELFRDTLRAHPNWSRVGVQTYAMGVPMWREIDSYSDGMCGWVEFENDETSENVKYYWSVTDPICKSQSEARDLAWADFGQERPTWTPRGAA